tara:strand:- start:382 stop:534 length:153 start_codon:yes stop_codon:yes gene_type:complete
MVPDFVGGNWLIHSLKLSKAILFGLRHVHIIFKQIKRPPGGGLSATMFLS